MLVIAFPPYVKDAITLIIVRERVPTIHVIVYLQHVVDSINLIIVRKRRTHNSCHSVPSTFG